MSCTPEEAITVEELKTFDKDITTVNQVVTLQDNYTPEASDGKPKLTLAGMSRKAGGVKKGNYNDNPLLEDNVEYAYHVATQKSYKIAPGVTPPYQIDSTTYPDPELDPNLVDFRYLTPEIGGEIYHSKFDSVAEMIAADIQAGTIVRTKSYNNLNVFDDIGAAFYLILTSAQFGGIPDGFGDHQLSNGNVAVLSRDRYVYLEQYGVVSGSDSTPQAQVCIDKNNNVKGLGGSYSFNLIYNRSDVSLDFDDRAVITPAASSIAIIGIDCTAALLTRISLGNMELVGTGTHGIYVRSNGAGNNRGVDWLKIHDVEIRGGFSVAGIELEARSIWSEFKNIEIRESSIGFKAETNGDINNCVFENVRCAFNSTWGMRFQNEGFSHQNNTFTSCNFEFNNTSVSPSFGGFSAGGFINTLNMIGCYFEGNGDETNGFDIKIGNNIASGDVIVGLNIESVITGGAQYAMYLDAQLISGSVNDIRLGSFGSSTQKIAVRTDHPDANVQFGTVYPSDTTTFELYGGNTLGQTPYSNPQSSVLAVRNIFFTASIPDVDVTSNGMVHFRSQSNSQSITLSSNPFLGGVCGQKLVVCVSNFGSFSGSSVTIPNSPSPTFYTTSRLPDASVGVITKSGGSLTLTANGNDTATFIHTGNNWKEM